MSPFGLQTCFSESQSCDLPRHSGRLVNLTCGSQFALTDLTRYGTVIGLRAFPLAQAYRSRGAGAHCDCGPELSALGVCAEKAVPHDTGYTSARGARSRQAGKTTTAVFLFSAVKLNESPMHLYTSR